MLNPGELNLQAWQGATYYQKFIIQETDTSNPIVFTGDDTALMQLRKSANSVGNAILVFTTDNNTITLNAQGEVVLSQTEDVMAAVPPGDYVYDLEIKHAGSADKYLTGRFTIHPTPTRG